MTARPNTPAADEILGRYAPVLDHGFVSLVDYMGGDADIERAARVSYGYGTRKSSATRGLIRYLMRHWHTTPFEMVELKFHVAMPMFVARQWIRHRTASVNEYSGRYSLMPMLFYTPERENFMLQSATNRQGRAAAAPDEMYDACVSRWHEARQATETHYGALTGDDVARELARIDLPLSTYTQWYWKIDLHNLFHFLTLRVDPHAQYEIRVFAEVMAGMAARVAPLAYEAWIDYRFAAGSLSRMEVAALAELVTAEGEGDGVRARDGAALDGEALAAHGLSAREIRELAEKLRAPEVPDFTLDPDQLVPAEHFERKMAEAVPEVDRKQS